MDFITRNAPRVSRSRAERVKKELKKIFPSFKEEIDRVRVRHHIELVPSLVFPKQPGIGASDVQEVYERSHRVQPWDRIQILADTERYISKFLGLGRFFAKRTYGAHYFPTSWEQGIGLYPTDVHEFIHFLTTLHAEKMYGKWGMLRVPPAVHEGISFAFQKKFIDENPQFEQLKSPEEIARKYLDDPRFDPDLFQDVFRVTVALIERHGFDGAAQRIPLVLQKFVRRPVRKGFKRR